MGSFKINSVQKRTSSYDNQPVVEIQYSCGDPRCMFDKHVRVFYYKGELPISKIKKAGSFDELVKKGMLMHIIESTVCTHKLYPDFELNLVLFGALAHGSLMDPKLGSQLYSILRAGIELSQSPPEDQTLH